MLNASDILFIFADFKAHIYGIHEENFDELPVLCQENLSATVVWTFDLLGIPNTVEWRLQEGPYIPCLSVRHGSFRFHLHEDAHLETR